MKEISLSLSLLPIGPRQGYTLAVGQVWRFALQVAVGFSDPPGPGDNLDRWAVAMLPWVALEPGETIGVTWGLFKGQRIRASGTVGAMPEGDLKLQSQGLPKPSPHEWLNENGDARWRAFVRDPVPPRILTVPSGRQPVESSAERLFVPSVIQTVGGATPELSSGNLRCTWYFDIRLPEEFVGNVLDGPDPPILAAWPVGFRDTRGPTMHYAYSPAPKPQEDFNFVDGVLAIRYQAAGVEPSHRARTLPLQIGRLLKTNELILQDYWLPTSDSRLDSLAEIQQLVADGLRPATRVNFLTPESVVAAGIPRPGCPDALADARVFLEVARKVFSENRAQNAAEQAAEAHAVQELIKQAMAGQAKALMDNLRAALVSAAVTWWSTGHAIDAINARATADGTIGATQPWPVAGVDPTPLFAGLGAFFLPAQQDVRPLLPGAGIDLLLGPADRRLRHEESDPATDDTGNDSEHAQVAELGILARRAETLDALKAMPWSLVTGGVVAMDVNNELQSADRYWGSAIDVAAGVTDETIPYDRRPVVRGVKSVFLNRVAHTDITYRGLPMAVATVGSALHDFQGSQDPASVQNSDVAELLPISYQPVGPVFNQAVAGHRQCLVPPLRCGDWYQFAGFVIDRAGGIPAELALPAGRPLSCHFNWDQLAAGRIQALDDHDPETGKFRAIEYLRAVPVGEINVRPLLDAEQPTERPTWPALPEDVVLRAREWLSSRVQGVDNVPALLLSEGPEFRRPTFSSYRFRVSAPALDELTLKEWLMPPPVTPGNAAELAAARAALERLNDMLAWIHRERASLGPIDWANQKDVLPADPAVSRIGLRCWFVNEHGAAREARTFLQAQAVLHVEIGATSDVRGDEIAVAPGTFAVLELVPLVAAADYARFQPLAMRALVEENPWYDDAGRTYIAFQPSRILVETATATLPPAADVYKSLTLNELENSAIEVSLVSEGDQRLAGLAFVDRFELHRQRWVWRNRPIMYGKGSRPQSALPVALADPATRDTAVSVLAFDALAELDRGLVDRGRIGGRLPRANDGRPLSASRLLIDDRDAVAHADYLRFGCALISRYAGILQPARQRVDAESRHDNGQAASLERTRRLKRITARFRGDLTRLKAPKVLAILPLTQSVPAPDGVETSPDATPFLIVLDEVWFREYGAGERLSLEVVLETKEIGEEASDERPFRVGPLPDHYVTKHLDNAPFVDRRLFKPSTDQAQQQAASRHVWPLVGPFGYSLDRSGNEALPNATAFVAYPPKVVRSHYAAFVRLRRQLYRVDGMPVLKTGKDEAGNNVLVPAEGPPGATYALYAQPDAKALVGAGTVLEIDTKLNSWKGLALSLAPVADLHPDVAKQYRYLLLVGPTHHDFGRGSDLFLPQHTAWLNPSASTLRWSDGKPFQTGSCSGRILELLLNGRFGEGQAPIEGSLEMKDILRLLFAHEGNPKDAPAMIRRVSLAFEIEVH